MKINELISDFEIFVTNEEQSLLGKMSDEQFLETFTEREKVVIENLIRKSLVSKIRQNNSYLVVRNVKH